MPILLTVSIVSQFAIRHFLAFDFSQFLAIPRLSSEGVCSTPPPANVAQEDEDEEWEPVDRDHVVKFFQVINAQSHTQMVREISKHILAFGRLDIYDLYIYRWTHDNTTINTAV